MIKFALYALCMLADIGGGNTTPTQTESAYVTYADLYAQVEAGNTGMLYVGVQPTRGYYIPVCYVPVLAGYNPGVYNCRLHQGVPCRFPVSLAPAAPVVPAPTPCLNGLCPKVR